MQIRKVSIDDVYPVEDELGNAYLSRDYSLKENQRYVEELARSFGESGEPNEPPVLVEDGGIYRIKAGSSRIMAMRMIGTKAFTAVIDEDDTPQALVEAAVRTNTKKAYEPVELSRFVQQLLLFGTDEYVSEVTGRSVEEVRKARRTRENVEDAADDLTIERMIALADFEDDPEAYQRILNAREADWRRIADEERRRVADEDRKATICVVLSSRGVRRVDDTTGLSFVGCVRTASELPDELPEGAVFSLGDWQGANASIYAETEERVDADEEARKARRAEMEALYEATKEHREDWLLSHLSDDLTPLFEIASDSPYNYRMNGFLDSREVVLEPTTVNCLEGYVEHSGGIVDWQGDPDKVRCGCFVSLTEAMRACGYEPCQEEETLYQVAEETLEEADDE